MCVYLALQVSDDGLAAVVQIQAKHQDICGCLCRGLDASSVIPPYLFLC